ncbi:MAG: hypothetical protein NWE98_06010 [Candidatus Bathyarchaeota archaeon]|nr:hypothetical protein [Candidatus Bathyarchaeota archaeon]
MLPHPQPDKHNIEPCTACGEKCISYTQADKEKQPKSKKQLKTQTAMWQPQNIHTHIKHITQVSIDINTKKVIQKIKKQELQIEKKL